MLIQIRDRVGSVPAHRRHRSALPAAAICTSIRALVRRIDPRSNAQSDGGDRPIQASADRPGIYGAHEQRRMRSGELHYLDHPKFGVLARVDPMSAARRARRGTRPRSAQPQPPAGGVPAQ